MRIGEVLTMAEYIEREAAIAKCREIAACEWNHRASPVSWADAYEQFAEDIEEIPTADVAPVRKGRWESVGLSSLKCSDCGYLDDMKMYHRYCPDCGCFMR